MAEAVITMERRKPGRPKGTTGRSWAPRPRQTAEQLLANAAECGAMAGVSGSAWAAQCRKQKEIYPQPRQYPPGSNRRVWIREEVRNFLVSELPPFQ